MFHILRRRHFYWLLDVNLYFKGAIHKYTFISSDISLFIEEPIAMIWSNILQVDAHYLLSYLNIYYLVTWMPKSIYHSLAGKKKIEECGCVNENEMGHLS